MDDEREQHADDLLWTRHFLARKGRLPVIVVTPEGSELGLDQFPSRVVPVWIVHRTREGQPAADMFLSEMDDEAGLSTNYPFRVAPDGALWIHARFDGRDGDLRPDDPLVIGYAAGSWQSIMPASQVLDHPSEMDS